MTRSPDLRVLINMCCSPSCSTIKQLMFGLKPPVPKPMMMMAVIKHPREAPWLTMMGGMAERMRMKWPKRLTPRAVLMVL